MRRKDRNPAVDRLLYRSGADLTLREWKKAFRAFQAFEYSSSEERFMDLETVILIGLALHRRNRRWKEFDALVQMILSEASPRGIWPEKTYLNWERALALLQQGNTRKALDFYLKEMGDLKDKSLRRMAYMMGISLFLSLWPDRMTSGPLRAPEELISFARGLISIHYPHRPMPLVLRTDRKKRQSTYDQVHRALANQ